MKTMTALLLSHSFTLYTMPTYIFYLHIEKYDTDRYFVGNFLTKLLK